MKMKRSKLEKYSAYFDDSAFIEKVRLVAGKASSVVVYAALILYYLLSDKAIPPRNKLIIVAALGYFIFPADLIADIIPGLGFTDDIAFLSYAISTVSSYLTSEVKEKAMQKMKGTAVEY